eukprot:603920-Prorocentrum_minimum.AAC.3
MLSAGQAIKGEAVQRVRGVAMRIEEWLLTYLVALIGDCGLLGELVMPTTRLVRSIFGACPVPENWRVLWKPPEEVQRTPVL